ncbi:MAG: EAL domain-containing protein, partial [Janthinobacterium lividum]
SKKAKQAIVRGIVGICADLDVTVLAEGIETPAERDWLRNIGVCLMQGYLFSKPTFESLAVVDDGAWE